MANNVALPPSGTGDSGKSARTIEKSASIQTQVIQLDVGNGTTESLVDTTNPMPVGGIGSGAFWPDPIGARKGSAANGAQSQLLTDPEGNLMVRGGVSTDETSVREDFPGSALAVALTGTVTYVNGSTAITGSGTAFLTELYHGDYIKLDAHAESVWIQIASILSDTEAVLVSGYTGASTSGASSTTVFRPVTGSGGGNSVSNSSVSLTSGTTIAALTGITREVDYGPMTVTFSGVTASQRIANNDMVIGLHDTIASPTRFARFRMTSTTNTAIIFESAFVRSGTPGANDTETTNITLPNNGTTAVARRYRIEVLSSLIRAYIDDVLVAEHRLHMPRPYDVMDVVLAHINGASSPATTTTLACDMILVENYNKLSIAVASNTENISASNVAGQVISGSSAALNADNIALDCLQFRALSVQITSVGGGATFTFQGSNDGTTWVSLLAYPLAGGAPVSTSTAVGQWYVPLTARYFRLRTTAYTSGTQTSNVLGIQNPAQLQNISALQGGTWNIGTVTTVTTLSTLTNITNWGNVADNAAFTDGTTRLSMDGFIFDETAGTALTENDAAAARIDSKRAQVLVVEDATTRGQRQAVNTSGGASVTPTPHTAGGLTPNRVISAASTNATSVKASAGQVFTIIAVNTNAAVRYLKLYNKASAPTVGTDTPVLTIPIPGNAAGAGVSIDTGGMGIAFATGIALAITTGVADADTGAVAANEIVVNLLYK